MTAANILPTLLDLAIAPDSDERWGRLLACAFRIIESPEASEELIDVMAEGAEDAVATAAQDVLSIALRRALEAPSGGQDFIERISRLLAAKANDLPAELRLIFVRAFIDADIPPPDGLTLGSDQLARLASLGAVNLSTPEALSGWIEKILRDADRDRLALALNLNELLVILPRKERHAAIRAISQANDSSAQWLVLYWLLDLSPQTRHAAANALAELARDGRLRPDIRHHIEIIQHWMPQDEARETLSGIIAATSPGPAPQPRWHLGLALATVPDGTGDQMLALMLDDAKGKDAAFAIVYHTWHYGLRDAILTITDSRKERDFLVQQVADTTPLLRVTPTLVTTILADGVSRRLARQAPAPPGLVDYLEIDGGLAVRPPEPLPPARIMREMNIHDELARMPAAVRQEAVAFGGAISASLPSFETWFEDPRPLRDAFAAAPNNAARETLIFDTLERRRAFWANQLALTAAVLKSSRDADPPFWKACAASALELEAGRACADIPFLRIVAARSWEALADITGKGGRGKARDIALKGAGRSKGGSRRGSRTR